MQAVTDHALVRRMRAVTLTTFRAVPWNGPYYRSLGFTVVAPAPGTHLFQALAEESARGLPDRCAMKLAL